MRPGEIIAAYRFQRHPEGGWTLALCVVSPGFDYADFSMPSREELLREHPDKRELVLAFTR